MIEDLTTSNLLNCKNAVLPAAEQTIESAGGEKKKKTKPQTEVKKTETKSGKHEDLGTVEIDPNVPLFSRESLIAHNAYIQAQQGTSDIKKEEVEELEI